MATSKMTAQAPGALRPHPHNSRRHSPDQVKELRASIRQFGMVAPIIVNPKGIILAGHGICEAAIAEELESVPVLVVTGLTDLEERGYLVVDNRLAEKSRWDPLLLSEELSLLAPVIDLADLGFSKWDPESGLDAFTANQKEIMPGDLDTEYTCPCCGFEF